MKFKDDDPQATAARATVRTALSLLGRCEGRSSTTHEYVILFKMLRVFCKRSQVRPGKKHTHQHTQLHNYIHTYTQKHKN